MEKLVENYMTLAERLARKKCKELPNHISFDEILSAAYMGLVDAASRFDETKGVAFSTYAYIRIHGEINDYLREISWGKRGDFQMACSLDKPLDDSDGDMWKDTIVSKENHQVDYEEDMIIIGIGLTDYSKDVMRLYFFEDFSMKEIGDKFGITESRVSQIISASKRKIQETWTQEDLRTALAA